MTEVGNITLENEMDLVLAKKRMTSVASYLQFTISTQTTLATAVAEVAREVIDKTNQGRLTIGVADMGGKNFLFAKVVLPASTGLTLKDAGLSYARKLMPSFVFDEEEMQTRIEMQIGIPRFVKLDEEAAKRMETYFKELPPATPYEAIKQHNYRLVKKSDEQGEQLRYSRYLSDKKSEFISIASHELKTPLTSIKAYAQLALKLSEEECSHKVNAFLQKIDAQTSKLQQLIQQLLDVSVIESGRLDFKVEQVLLVDFIKEVVGTMRPILPNHIIHFNWQNAGSIVSIDRLRMEQVFINLLNNAAKYSAPGSNIYITCSQEENDTVIVSVRDEGIGMSQKNLKQIFEKFFREKQAIGQYSGMGVGLYITNNIIEQHGGKIWAESELKKGSQFYFTLPVQTTAPAEQH
jgi:signal transduction histidine kinase